ncbi:MAG: hypothetical protein OEU86_00505 [Gammaproteobacteria bacterium]|nr:hypothetical protein [Gammaproteobacteria bacterium]
MSNTIKLISTLIALTCLISISTAVSAADTKRVARVAGGQQVELAKPEKSDTELAAERPEYEKLKPKKR